MALNTEFNLGADSDRLFMQSLAIIEYLTGRSVATSCSAPMTGWTASSRNSSMPG